MDAFDSQFRDELSYLKLLGRTFAEENPELINLLSDSNSDPDVERLLEGFSFLVAGVQSKIKDAFPEITQNLLSRVWPFLLRPIPSTGIICFTGADNIIDLPLGAKLHAIRDKEKYSFTSCRSLHIEPVTLLKRTLIRSNDLSEITLTFRYNGKTSDWLTGEITLFLGSDPLIALELKLWFEQHLSKVYLRHNNTNTRLALDKAVVATSIPSAENLILPREHNDFWLFQFLAEFFHLPYVNNFITLDLRKTYNKIILEDDKTFDLIFVFDGVLPIEKIEHSFIPHCVPVVNLKSENTTKLPFIYNESRYTLPLINNEAIFKICSIYSDAEPEKILRGDHIQFLPISFINSSSGRFAANKKNLFFYEIQIERTVIGTKQLQLIFYDNMCQPIVAIPQDSFVCNYLSYNPKIKNLQPGDTFLPSDDIQSMLTVSSLTPLSRIYPPVTDNEIHWALISALSFSPLFLNNVTAIKSLIKQFDFYATDNRPHSQRIQRAIDGIINVTAKPADRLWHGQPVRGTQMTLVLDQTSFDHAGEMYAFACALNHFFTFCLTENNFLQMKVINQQTNEQWSLQQIPGHRRVM